MMRVLQQVTVVGASLAGISVADKLRSLGFDGKIVLFGAEQMLPYDRPPLSKQILAGDGGETPALLRPAHHYTDLDIELCLGMRAQRLDVRSRELELATGKRFRFDGLVLACGAQPRRLEIGRHLRGIHVLRTMEDSLRLRDALGTASSVAIIGAGLIGSEVASAAIARGLPVVLVEPGPTPMPRIVGRHVGDYCAALQRAHGVDLRLERQVSEFVGRTRVEAVRLNDGAVVPADVVVLGIGAEPATDWLLDSRIRLSDGIVCDAQCRVAPGIYAAGDVARWQIGTTETCRVEHWANAVEQGETVAGNLLGQETGHVAAGYFWSDQFGKKIQFAGRVAPDCSECVFSENGQRGRVIALYGKAGRLCGAVAFDWPAMLIACRRLVAAKATWECAQAEIAEAVGERIMS
jgi:3-phenylpropionate/trans-cinnamate dioxygenase ferredoxin reductase subunit